MESENTFSPEKRKPRAFLQFGLPGHENEYVFTTSTDEDIPSDIAATIEQALGSDWEVLYRVSRIEISNRKESWKRQDDLVNNAIQKALEDNYIFKLLE